MGGPKPHKKSPCTKGPVAVLSKGSSTPWTTAPLDTGLTVAKKGRVWAANDKQAGILSCNQPGLHSHRQEVQIWAPLLSSHLQQRIGEAVFQERTKKRQEVTLTTLEPFNCKGLDISSKPLTSCLGTQCRGACALTQHLFYLLADWTHFTVKRGQLGCKGIKNTGGGEKLFHFSTFVAEDRL